MRWLREPLLHFLLLGAGLFAVYHYVRPASITEPSSKQIVLSLEEISGLAKMFQSQWKRAPTVQELEHLIENRVREEILYREALALGLDKDDTVVRRRMAQKMQFLAEDVAVAREPTTAELKAWYRKNSAMFALPSRVSFRHLYFSPDLRGERTRDDAASALVKLVGQPEDSKLAASLADPFMFQDYYRDRAPEHLGKEFGPQFALAVAKLPPGKWMGPIGSGFGWHLVFVDTLIPGSVPAFEEIEPEVKSAWQGELKALAWQTGYRDMRAKYTVLLPAPPEDARPSPVSAAPVASVSPDSSVR
jgi:hypothetical protein